MRSHPVVVGPRQLPGLLALPDLPLGLVVFAHGSGSSRLSPRNHAVAGQLHARGLATLLFDLLDAAEAAERACVFDIPLLASRLLQALDWAATQPALATLPCGLFGASTGAAAALCAAAARPASVRAVVSRGGRPDLAADALAAVIAPTLLIVGGADRDVLALNRWALERMSGSCRLTVVPGASHLFEEPGALDAVARAAGDWFVAHLSPQPGPHRPTSRPLQPSGPVDVC